MTTLLATGVSTEVLLGTANALLYGLALWMGHEWWKDHKAQHKQLDESITRLSEVYASKTSVHRAHKRLDDLDAVTADHAERLARLEAMQEIKRDCSCER